MTLPGEYMLPCLNKTLFGLDCLGCGLQRSISLVFHGELIAAFKMYPAIYPLIFLFAFIGVNFFIKFEHSSKIINALAITTITTIVISCILKITD